MKNRESRTVPLNGELKEVLLPLRNENGYCFLNRKSEQFGATQLTGWFNKLIVEPSGPPLYRPHPPSHLRQPPGDDGGRLLQGIEVDGAQERQYHPALRRPGAEGR